MAIPRNKKDNLTLILKNEIQTVHTSTSDFHDFIKKKICRVYEIIQSTFTSLELYNSKDLFSNSDTNQHFEILHDLYKRSQNLSVTAIDKVDQIDKVIDDLQKIFDKLSASLASVGTQNVRDLLYIVFGANYDHAQNIDVSNNELFASKVRVIDKYVMPIGYKNIPWKSPVKSGDGKSCSDKIVDTTAPLDVAPHMECFDTNIMFTSLGQSIYGLRVVVHNHNDKKTVILHGQVESIPVYCITNEPFIKHRLDEIQKYFDELTKSNKISKEVTTPSAAPDITRNTMISVNPQMDQNPNTKQENTTIAEMDTDIISRWIDTLTLKDILVYSLDDLYKKYRTMLIDVKYVKENRVDTILKHFFDMDILSKRKMLAHLFIYNKDNEIHYISYMLYDLISSANASSDSNNIDNLEQKQVYDSFSWKLKMYFKETMVNTLQFSQDAISKYDVSKISIEQRILLMRTDDKIKDRAMAKLKELKGKSDDQGSKAKQYLEGLIKVPFGIYKREPILSKIENINDIFALVSKEYRKSNITIPPEICNNNQKSKYTIYEIDDIMQYISEQINKNTDSYLTQIIPKLNKPILTKIIAGMGTQYTGLHTKPAAIEYIMQNIGNYRMKMLKCIEPTHSNISIYDKTLTINSEIKYVHNSIDQMKERLDQSIYGHEYAKSQIMKIIGQWMNGEQNGYCFGFEGSPGIGKTSLAKRGLAQCLQDELGVSRPFSFIALGGSCNGSTLEGHNYTYVNSMWGKVVDILMESKCMNPIIYIDELDKVSKTEQGREIIGILTHLIDTTQNDDFQDRYFNGIPFDLSKALFIFSYNDPEQIDRILLDRIHRIKFDNLSWSDKLVIVKQFIIPELNKKFGFDGTVEMADDVVEHIVEQYTMEPGIRKLKEILFDIYGEINVELLQSSSSSSSSSNTKLKLPIQITIQDLGIKYIKKYRKIQDKKIHTSPVIGTINGMWANALGKGGIIPVETMFFPSSTFLDLKLTGLQGDVMKESMNVAKSLAWSITPIDRQKELIQHFESTKNQGLHIHCPEGAVSKDGPSAGAAITLAIYSLFNKLPIKNTVSITGETNLQGDITAIGGLEFKIFGSMRAGVKTILYPKSNQTDFDEFIVKYGKNLDTTDMTFIAVEHVRDAIPHFM